MAAALESGPGFAEQGRWSIFACEPDLVFSVLGDQYDCRPADGQSHATPSWTPPPTGSTPLDAFRWMLDQTKSRSPDRSGKHRNILGEPLPFVTGWIGFIGYDFAPQLERLPRRHLRSSILPDMYWMHFSNAVLLDRRSARFIEVGEPARSQITFAWEGEDLESLGSPLGSPTATGIVGDWSPDEYRRAARRIVEYTHAGDIFQANLTHRFSTRLRDEWATPRGVAELWNRCQKASPAPFSACLRTPEWSILSTSPERFLHLDGKGRIESQPIKGTRPRGQTPQADQAAAAELLASLKDAAELNMIVDLVRNDLGRVCQFGSVQVEGHRRLDSYANVHHLSSTIVGRLRPGGDIVDALSAAFPGGSVTGAPKIRAMQIIDEIEPVRRGVYTGAIGYIDDRGSADLNIAIRTLVIEGPNAHFHVGGGVVADSRPEDEFQESLVKGSRLRAVLTEVGDPHG